MNPGSTPLNTEVSVDLASSELVPSSEYQISTERLKIYKSFLETYPKKHTDQILVLITLISEIPKEDQDFLKEISLLREVFPECKGEVLDLLMLSFYMANDEFDFADEVVKKYNGDSKVISHALSTVLPLIKREIYSALSEDNLEDASSYGSLIEKTREYVRGLEGSNKINPLYQLAENYYLIGETGKASECYIEIGDYEDEFLNKKDPVTYREVMLAKFFSKIRLTSLVYNLYESEDERNFTSVLNKETFDSKNYFKELLTTDLTSTEATVTLTMLKAAIDAMTHVLFDNKTYEILNENHPIIKHVKKEIEELLPISEAFSSKYKNYEEISAIQKLSITLYNKDYDTFLIDSKSFVDYLENNKDALIIKNQMLELYPSISIFINDIFTEATLILQSPKEFMYMDYPDQMLDLILDLEGFLEKGSAEEIQANIVSFHLMLRLKEYPEALRKESEIKESLLESTLDENTSASLLFELESRKSTLIYSMSAVAIELEIEEDLEEVVSGYNIEKLYEFFGMRMSEDIEINELVTDLNSFVFGMREVIINKMEQRIKQINSQRIGNYEKGILFELYSELKMQYEYLGNREMSDKYKILLDSLNNE